jgi:hypothetical protein
METEPAALQEGLSESAGVLHSVAQAEHHCGLTCVDTPSCTN